MARIEANINNNWKHVSVKQKKMIVWMYNYKYYLTMLNLKNVCKPTLNCAL